mmetsp:Transcript_10154/g.15102  ORF Transcript_10154/g.15102 Transcript_10154/m.15102 type:complete len:83 (-) Transcript_10154:827-1075(-)
MPIHQLVGSQHPISILESFFADGMLVFCLSTANVTSGTPNAGLPFPLPSTFQREKSILLDATHHCIQNNYALLTIQSSLTEE